MPKYPKTGFFENVESNNKQTKEKDRTDIILKVKEKPTGQFNVGGGFSSTNGALANVGIAEKNFLGKKNTLNYDEGDYKIPTNWKNIFRSIFRSINFLLL